MRWIGCFLGLGMAGLVGCGGAATEEEVTVSAVDANPTAEAEEAVEALGALVTFDLAAAEALIAEAAAADQVLVIDFWGTWCGPCLELFPGLHDAMVGLGPSVRPATVAWDIFETEQSVADIRAYLIEQHATEDAYILSNTETDAVYARVSDYLQQPGAAVAYPMVMVFNQSGELAQEFHGNVTAEEVAQAVEALLQEQG